MSGRSSIATEGLPISALLLLSSYQVYHIIHVKCKKMPGFGIGLTLERVLSSLLLGCCLCVAYEVEERLIGWKGEVEVGSGFVLCICVMLCWSSLDCACMAASHDPISLPYPSSKPAIAGVSRSAGNTACGHHPCLGAQLAL